LLGELGGCLCLCGVHVASWVGMLTASLTGAHVLEDAALLPSHTWPCIIIGCPTL
jgi:hypothetical protein